MSRLGYWGSFEKQENSHYYRIIPLATEVLVVASVNVPVGDWAAYIDAVHGESHEKEWHNVKRMGSKLSQHIAEAIFPELKEKYRWRD